MLWGPFFGTNTQTLSYQVVGPPGNYAVQASWSVDGVGGGEPAPTNIVIASTGWNPIPTPPQQVAPVTFSPPSGGNVPVSVTITDPTPGAAIYYTLDGSLPTQNSMPYAGPVYLASASAVRAVAFVNGWTPSVASVAYYRPAATPANAAVTRTIDTSSPATPLVTFNVTPGAGASCIAVTEWLPAGVSATSVSAAGNYIASNNVVLWGPFFGSAPLTLSYQASGLPGVYPVQASWSVDGVGGGEMNETDLVIASSSGGVIPTPPPQVPVPTISPSVASTLPVTVTISDGDPQAQVFFTTDGTLPTQNSTPYTVPLTFTAQTTLRARAFRTGYLPSVAALGEYVPPATTNTLALVRSIANDGSFLPTVTLTATPQGPLDCYAVTETLAPGLTPSALSGDAFWDALFNTIRWGPYLDNRPRVFTYNVGGPSGTYPLAGEGSFDGHSVGMTGTAAVDLNDNYSGSGPTNLAACASDNLTSSLNINPSPGVVTVTSATGTVDWGDGTQSAITQPVMTFEKSYSAAGTYALVVSADWVGYTTDQPMSGHATRTDTIQVLTNCAAPQIVTQPTDQVALAGATAQFSVSATSPFPMSYQWYYNTNTPIVSPSSLSTLSLPDATPQSAGYYSVVVANAFGSSTSSVAQLTVVSPLVTGATRHADGSVTLSFAGLPNSAVRVWVAT